MKLAALLGVLAVAGVGAFVALAASAPSAPSITPSPATSPTNSATMTLTFSSSGNNTYKCGLDGAVLAACTSPKTYGSVGSPLAVGSHTFQVQAIDTKNNASPVASYSWLVDRTAPTAQSVNRAGSSPTNAASVTWTVTFSEDVSGVQASNFQLVQSGLTGSPAISSVSPSSGAQSVYTVTASTGTGTTGASGTLQLNLSSAGTVKDRAGNSLGGTLPVVGQQYVIDKTAPAAPSISFGPAASPAWTTSTDATFTFSGESGASFLCKLDSGSFAACTSPKSYGGLAQGSHSFQVEAVDAAGNVSAPASRTWQVDTVPPAAPAISAEPANPTNQTSASFSFSGESGASFLCKLDSGAFTACTSPTSYTGLAEGSHTFQVEAKDAAGNIGPAASYSWRIDTSPPAITMTFPTNGGAYNAASWNAGCAGGAGICGTASDPSGVAAGAVSIQQQATGKWWNGSSFGATSETFNTVTITSTSGTTSSGRYPLAVPPSGSYLVHVRTQDGLGNAQTAANQTSLTFTIGTVAPPAPSITGHPANPTTADSASFTFTDSQAGVTFQCKLDASAYALCSSGISYTGLSNGSHTFSVQAKDGAGNLSGATSFSWTINAGVPFVVHGSVSNLQIGVEQSVPVTIDNPNDSAIHVSSLTVSLSTNAGSGTCTAANFLTTNWTAANTAAELLVPANATNVTVPVADRPKVKLSNLASNQDPCKSKTFTLTFGGSAHS